MSTAINGSIQSNRGFLYWNCGAQHTLQKDLGVTDLPFLQLQCGNVESPLR